MASKICNFGWFWIWKCGWCFGLASWHLSWVWVKAGSVQSKSKPIKPGNLSTSATSLFCLLNLFYKFGHLTETLEFMGAVTFLGTYTRLSCEAFNYVLCWNFSTLSAFRNYFSRIGQRCFWEYFSITKKGLGNSGIIASSTSRFWTLLPAPSVINFLSSKMCL